MPQRRKTPFSGKAKKLQLQSKKSSHRPALIVSPSDSASETGENFTSDVAHTSAKQGGRYALKFRKESEKEIKERRDLANRTLAPPCEALLETDCEDYFPGGLSFPQRPPWRYDISLSELEAKENRYFTLYMNDLDQKFKSDRLSHFEENLETWRQLWRVLEMSDILLFIVDVRFSNVTFPPAVYDVVVKQMNKDMILLLNKVDLAPPSLVAAWMGYFKKNYPLLNIVLFTSVPGYNLRGEKRQGNTGLQMRRRKGKIRMSAEGASKLQETCQDIVGNSIDLSTWKNKIKEEMNIEYNEDLAVQIEDLTVRIEKQDTGYFAHEKFKDNILTIGCLGQPNVGKSSVINALMGKKVVSVSKTPGHTKHFQTIFLTKNVRLCDCPGLVFPSRVPKPLQVLMGSFPIAQLKEPYTAIKFLAERINLVKLLGISHPDKEAVWSAVDICDGWAIKRGFFTAKAARPDSYRGANSILRMALDGVIPFSFAPPEYFNEKSNWENSNEINQVNWILAVKGEEDGRKECELTVSEEDSDITSDASSDTDASVKDNSEDMSEKKIVVKNKFSMLDLDSD